MKKLISANITVDNHYEINVRCKRITGTCRTLEDNCAMNKRTVHDDRGGSDSNNNANLINHTLLTWAPHRVAVILEVSAERRGQPPAQLTTTVKTTTIHYNSTTTTKLSAATTNQNDPKPTSKTTWARAVQAWLRTSLVGGVVLSRT